MRFVQFGCIGTVWLPYETRCETGQISAKIRATKSRRNFSQRTHPIHSIGPKTDVLVRSVPLGAFGTVWLPYETRCKMGRTSAKVRATKSRRNFSQQTYRVHPIRPQIDVLVRFKLFGCILDRLVALGNSVQNGPNKYKSSCHEVVSEFFAMNTPNPTHLTLN